MEPADLAGPAARALEPVLGPVDVTLGEPLPSSDRALVVRAVARDPDRQDHRLVLKAPLAGGPGGAREQAALELLAARDLPGVVRLLAVADEPPLLVLADVGTGPTLADRLLGRDPAAAEAGVVGWAAQLGRLQAATAGAREEFGDRLAALSPFGAPALDTSTEALVEAGTGLARGLPRLGVQVPRGTQDELRELAAALDAPGAPGALVPGDTCPSNAIETADGPVLLDFEGAQYRHLAWEAAYLTVPWPSCWCSWRLPDPLVARALDAWQQAVVSPLAADDLVRATVGWVFISTGWLLAGALDGDLSVGPGLVPSRRALVQHRLGLAATAETALLPALRELAERTHAATVRVWGDQALPLAPAFR